MADPRLESPSDYAYGDFTVIREGLMVRYGENIQLVIERLLAAWEADRTRRAGNWVANADCFFCHVKEMDVE